MSRTHLCGLRRRSKRPLHSSRRRISLLRYELTAARVGAATYGVAGGCGRATSTSGHYGLRKLHGRGRGVGRGRHRRHLPNLNLLLDVQRRRVHAAGGVGRCSRCRSRGRVQAHVAAVRGRGASVAASSSSAQTGRGLMYDLPLPQDLQFARAVAFVHGAELVAAASHAIVPHG